jgi:hypothetical protein
MLSPPLTKIGAASKVNERLRVAVVMVGSALLLAALIVSASALGTSILGVPTSYGNGVDSRFGAQVIRDFLADQEAEATALSTGDQTPLGGRFTDSALSDLVQQISSQSSRPPMVRFQPSSLTVLRALDRPAQTQRRPNRRSAFTATSGCARPAVLVTRSPTSTFRRCPARRCRPPQ